MCFIIAIGIIEVLFEKSISTIWGQMYRYEDYIFSTIDNIFTRIRNTTMPLGGGLVNVLNLANPEEDFTDNWNKALTMMNF
ncbi:MAG: hypothetical protein EOO46_15120 [Flavobacterium sp.]|nr:MAG: hypothetical protein EOO46_15120 [Flavobacterium sp.]